MDGVGKEGKSSQEKGSFDGTSELFKVLPNSKLQGDNSSELVKEMEGLAVGVKSCREG